MKKKQHPIHTSAQALIAPCGMNCALCASHLALRYDVKSKGVHIPYCRGCQLRDKQCAFLKKQCSRLKLKQVQYCYECPAFPCKNLRGLDTRYRSLFHMSMIENLQYIQDYGIQQFLEEEQKRWKCPACGEVLCCHNGLCFQCNVDGLKTKKHMYRWE